MRFILVGGGLDESKWFAERFSDILAHDVEVRKVDET